MEKITIKNVSSATVVISLPPVILPRTLTPGRSINISREDYDELSVDLGFEGLVRDHYVEVIGLEENEAVQENVFDYGEIEKIIKSQNITAFSKMIPNAKQAEKETIVQLAIDNGVTNPAFVTLIKKYCDTDIISAINMKHLAEQE